MEKFSFLWIIRFFLVSAFIYLKVDGIKIKEIHGPETVQNGTLTKLVLDCDYEMTDKEASDNGSGLVVKWYLDRKIFPIYQWIPEVQPQASGILKGRVDLQHVASNERLHRHRALAIVNPTPELTGEYTCWVSTFDNEDYGRKNVTIYSTAASIAMTYRKRSKDVVMISCKASGLYPQPTVKLFSNRQGTREEVTSTSTNFHLGVDKNAYNVSLDHQLSKYEMEQTTVYECVISIPRTDYHIIDEILYYPGFSTLSDSDTSGSSSLFVIPTISFLIAILMLYLTNLNRH